MRNWTWALVAAMGSSSGIATAAETGGLSFQPAPIVDMFPHPGRWDIGLTGAAGVVFPDVRSDPNITVLGLGGVVNRALDDRWFLIGGLQVAGGSQGDYSVTVAGLLLGGGLHIAGSVDDWYSVSALGGLAAVSMIVPASYPYTEAQITGAGISLAVQAELRAIKWLSVVPYLMVTHLASVTVELDGIEVLDAEVSETTASPGFDLWLYINPENRKQHFSLGVLGSLFTPTSSFIVTLGYGWSFGGAAETPVVGTSETTSPTETGLPPAIPPSPGTTPSPEPGPSSTPGPSRYLPPAVPPPVKPKPKTD